ncbi:MAG: hypothetical protein P9L97_08595 [Candidatus Tenebribacter davisii]|jgi:hypothetical protein|nr:hypothetical protein [Candidatus Tenebribacter davisii]
MIGKIIISIMFIPINAIILWVASSLGGDRESYKKALIATSLIFVISLFRFISFQGFYASILSNYLSGGIIEVITFLILWWLYKYDFWSILFMWSIWFILQFPFNILQNKILTLPWDSIMQAF